MNRTQGKMNTQCMSVPEKNQPACFLAHDLVNKLSAIVGFCQLLMEKAEQQDSERMNRLSVIHDLARSAAKHLTEYQCELSAVLRAAKLETPFPVLIGA